MTPSIKELQDRRADKKSAMLAITAKETDDEPLADEDIASFNKLKEEADQLEARIARLKEYDADNDGALTASTPETRPALCRPCVSASECQTLRRPGRPCCHASAR